MTRCHADDHVRVDAGRRRFLGVAAMTLASAVTIPARAAAEVRHARLAVAHARGDYVSVVHPATGHATRLAAGSAPHGLAVAPDGLLCVATGEGLALVDPVRGRRAALVPYATVAPSTALGEYRPGGWDGVTVLDLATRSQREIALADQPMSVVRLPA